jgi:hypothetical protein
MFNRNCPTLEIGDIFLKNSNKTGAKIVKFFMQSKTVWHWIYEKITKKLQEVPYYHAGIVMTSGGEDFESTIFEQQWEFETSTFNYDWDCIVFRKRDLTLKEEDDIIKVATLHLGKKWDILNAVGKFLTWLTGLQWFANNVEIEGMDICICRVCRILKEAGIEDFNGADIDGLTTQTVYEYLENSPEWECVYVNK